MLKKKYVLLKMFSPMYINRYFIIDKLTRRLKINIIIILCAIYYLINYLRAQIPINLQYLLWSHICYGPLVISDRKGI